MSVKVIKPRRFSDSRGWFSETWNAKTFADEGLEAKFCQDNHSRSERIGTLRGLHFQRAPHAQAKLVRCVRGRIFDVAVDIRRHSPTYKHWVGVELSAEIGNQMFIPKGYAHGFLTLEHECEVAYKVDSFYAAQADGGVAWDDAELGIIWPSLSGGFHFSDKDAALPKLAEAQFEFGYDGSPLLPFSNPYRS